MFILQTLNMLHEHVPVSLVGATFAGARALKPTAGSTILFEMPSTPYEIVTTSAGAISIRDNSVNEIMHNPVGPWVEANALYIDQSKLEERLRDQPSVSEFVIFDVGLGAAANAIAALSRHRRLANSGKLSGTKLKIVSYEK